MIDDLMVKKKDTRAFLGFRILISIFSKDFQLGIFFLFQKIASQEEFFLSLLRKDYQQHNRFDEDGVESIDGSVMRNILILCLFVANF